MFLMRSPVFRSIADGVVPLVCGQLIILFRFVKFTLRNVNHLEEQTTSGSGLSNVQIVRS